jgi:phage/plasmid-associated DNA primase
VPFRATFDEQTRDPFILEKLKSERAGIFNMMYAAYKNLIKRGYLEENTLQKEIREEHALSTDPVRQWFTETLRKTNNVDAFEATNDLYASYKNYMEDMNMRKILNKHKFSMRLCALIGSKSTQRKEDGRVARGYKGVEFISDLTPKY